MSPFPWLILAGAFVIVSFILLTPGFRKMLSRTYDLDPFAQLEDRRASIGRPVQFTVSLPSDLRPGLEGAGSLSRYRVVGPTKVLFVPRHPWVFHDRGWFAWPTQGIITAVPGGVEVRAVAPPQPEWSRPLAPVLTLLLLPLLAMLYLISGRRVLLAQTQDVALAITRDASHNNGMQLTSGAAGRASRALH